MSNVSSQRRRRLRMYRELFARWGKIGLGQSYWHAPVGMGKHFVPGQLEGYYNDYRPKTEWNGPTDVFGIPQNRLVTGERFYFPLTIIQKALGHWERWLESGRSETRHREQFLELTWWIVGRQDPLGGWTTWPSCGVRSATPYSAMTQGQAVSLLVRAWTITDDDTFLKCAVEARTLMLKPVSAGGTARYVAEGTVLEEVPLLSPRTVLNGWINGVFGLYDLWLATASEKVRNELETTVAALVVHLPRYDAKFWSYYDTAGHLASPYYHQRHIAQMTACEQAFPEYGAAWRDVRAKFERHARSRTRRMAAVLAKVYQQLRQPPDSVMK